MVRVQRIDSTGLTVAIAAAREWSGRTPELAVTTAAFFIMRQVAREAPRSSVEQIDEELAVEVIPRIGTSGQFKGQVLSQKYAKNRTYKGLVGPSYKPPIPFTWLLIGARARPGSRYNELTHGRYMIAGGHPFTGKKVSEFAGIMIGYISRMTKGRHSSIAFIASATIPIIKWLEARISPKYRRGAAPRDSQAWAHSRRSRSSLGDVQLFGTGLQVSLEVDLLIGMGASVLSEEQNQAMHEKLGPVLQQAIDDEAEKSMNYVARESMKELSGTFTANGVLLSVN